MNDYEITTILTVALTKSKTFEVVMIEEQTVTSTIKVPNGKYLLDHGVSIVKLRKDFCTLYVDNELIGSCNNTEVLDLLKARILSALEVVNPKAKALLDKFNGD